MIKVYITNLNFKIISKIKCMTFNNTKYYQYNFNSIHIFGWKTNNQKILSTEMKKKKGKKQHSVNIQFQ